MELGAGVGRCVEADLGVDVAATGPAVRAGDSCKRNICK